MPKLCQDQRRQALCRDPATAVPHLTAGIRIRASLGHDVGHPGREQQHHHQQQQQLQQQQQQQQRQSPGAGVPLAPALLPHRALP